MLNVQNLSVKVEEKEILTDMNFQFQKGKNYCIVGENGSGKSSLALTIMGHPSYSIAQGEILLDQNNITDRPPYLRAQNGIFLAFQNIPAIQGVKLFEFLRTAYNARFNTDEKFVSFKKLIVPLLEDLHIDKDFLRRDLNVGFSGGEKRKIEILQMRLLQPTYIFLDEIDSGLDIDAFRQVANLLQSIDSNQHSLIIITHNFNILDYVDIDYVYLLQGGRIKKHGNINIIDDIKSHGFAPT